jgi:hypothetical protein
MYLANPKSAIFNVAFAVLSLNNKLSGFKSLCTNDCKRIADKPFANCVMKCFATASLTRPRFRINSDKFPPAQYSNIKYTLSVRKSSTTSTNFIMFLCFAFLNTVISNSNASLSFGCKPRVDISLIATVSFDCSSNPFQTVAKEPLPMGWFSSEEKIAYSFPDFMFLIIFLPLLFDEVEVGCFLKPSPFEEGADIIPIKLFISLLLSLSSVLLLASVFVARLVLLLLHRWTLRPRQKRLSSSSFILLLFFFFLPRFDDGERRKSLFERFI